MYNASIFAVNTSAYNLTRWRHVLVRTDHSAMNIRLAILFTASVVTLLLGLAGAILVLLAVFRFKGNKKTGFYSIVTSLVINIVVLKCLHIIFQIPTYATGSWVFGDALCKLSRFIYHVNAFSIVYHIILLMFYVIFCIKHPMIARKMDRPRNIAILLIVFWVVIIAVNAESLAYHKAYNYQSTYYESKSFSFCTRQMRHFMQVIILFILQYLIPFLMMIGLCITIGVTAHQRRTNRYVDLEADDERHLQEFKKLGIIFTVLHLVFSVGDVVFQMFLMGLFGNISFVMSMLYPAIIPWIFLACVREFRTTLKNLRRGGEPEGPVGVCNAANVEASVVAGQEQATSTITNYSYEQPDDRYTLKNTDDILSNSVLVEEI